MSIIETKCINCGHPLIVNLPEVADGSSVVRTEDMERLRRVETMAREVWTVLDDTYPDSETHLTPIEALRALRAALGDPS